MNEAVISGDNCGGAEVGHARLVILAVGALLIGVPSFGAEGLITRRSAHSVDETMNRLEHAVRARDLVVIARVDHAGAAQKAGLSLRPTQLLIFGHPKSGTPLMARAQTTGIDLPLKALVWQDEQGQVWLGYNDPAWLAQRHGIAEPLPILQAITSTLETLAGSATGSGP
jgi:uncharacterized protein (DUF302 family)